MADLFGTLPPELALEQQRLNRQQKMAEMLLAQGAQPQAAGQMVSGRYVPNSFFQNLQPVANMLVGAYMANKADKALASQYEKLAEEKKSESERLAKALRGQETVTEMAGPYGQSVGAGGANVPMPTATMQGQPDFRGAVDVIMQNRLGTGREMLPALMQQAYPEPRKPVVVSAGSVLVDEQGKPIFQAPYKPESNVEKAPAGYRFAPDGSLEPIKGGPADLKSQQKFAGQENVDTLISGLRDQYNILLANEGITSTKAGVIPNLRSAASRSAVGQAMGQTFGTANQSARNTIAQSRPLLLNAIKEATGMSAKQMDSNAELKMYLAAATDPNLDYESNIAALNQLERLFGTTSGIRGEVSQSQGKVVDFNSLPKRK